MGDNLMDENGMDLDLNQEPLEQHLGGAVSEVGSLINELENAHGRIYERIRQLEAVSARARQRQSWRRARNSVENGDVLLDPWGNGEGHGRIDSVGGIERSAERGKGYKRDSSCLVAKALQMDTETKKVDKGGGSFFDCNICLEMARDPILTCCGHLFCWICFCKLSYVDSTAKECPVCKGEVIDANIIPIYGNGNSTQVSEVESGLMVPPRPKAPRVESIRQQRLIRGPPHIPVAEALRRIRTSIGAIGDRLHEMPRSDENFNHDIISQESQIVHTTHHQFSRVLSESAASLSTISSALDDAQRLVGDVESYIGCRLLLQRSSRAPLISTDDRDPLTRDAAAVAARSGRQFFNIPDIASSSGTNDVPDAVGQQLENLTTTDVAVGTVPSELPPSLSSRRRRGTRITDSDTNRGARRRRLL